MKTRKQSNIFDSVLRGNHIRLQTLSKNKVSSHIRILGYLEQEYLKRAYKLDTKSERVVRFYTWNIKSKGKRDFQFRCPKYIHDTGSYMYDDFVEVCHYIGEHLLQQYNDKVEGVYCYDIKITLSYLSNVKGWELKYDWEILDTDNPRCIYGNPKKRRDCDYLINCNSKLIIEGYSLSGNYIQLTEVLSDLATKTILIHSKKDANALLKVLKFLGVKKVYVRHNENIQLNPVSCSFFSRRMYGYQLDKIDEDIVVRTVYKPELPINTSELLDIDEFIVKRSIKAKLKELIDEFIVKRSIKAKLKGSKKENANKTRVRRK